CSFSQQGVLTNSEIYRCEDLSTHNLTHVPAAPATCDTDGCTEHYICECGKGFAANVHEDALEQDSWIIPKTGHAYAAQGEGYVCANCSDAAASFEAAVAACEESGGTVTLSGNESVETLVVPANVSLDLGGNRFTVMGGLSVNAGGKITNGELRVVDGAAVSMGDNGGWVPVYIGAQGVAARYALYPIEMKVGAAVTPIEGGYKYAFGYKYADFAAYAASVGANGVGLKFGVALDLEESSADYSFSPDSVAKMEEVSDAADAFYRVNLSLIGDAADDVTVTPYVKLKELGFRYEAEGYTLPKTPVAEYAGTTYTSLEAAIAEAEKAGGFVDVYLIDDITFRSKTTIKLAGTTRLRVPYDKDITISGPVTFDGQGNDASCLLFYMPSDNSGNAGNLTLDGVTVKNYKNTGSGNDNTYGGIARLEKGTLTLKNCVFDGNAGTKRGAFYVTSNAVVNAENCEFKNNTALSEYGGVFGIYSTNGSTVKNCTFTNNKAVGSDAANDIGGSIHVRSGLLTIDGCTFEGGSAMLGDDVSVTNGSLTLKGVTKMNEVYLNTGKSVALGSSFALAEGADPIVIDGAVNTTVLTGSIVSTAYTAFAA
ncbi:MAG: right-handed parallel beta-helix repeat-containing protein, partial [Oscillospiraceae bacterium]|nr:right-handed parallel beta-helix repeat-containing protein [Oscillospiraceae bacterium]